MKKIILFILMFFNINLAYSATKAENVYLLAQENSVDDLKSVENIDVVDSDGNTALCSAIKYDDVDAYNILKKAGANTEHKCVKKIPGEQYKTFLHKVGVANKSWSFLGMGKWAWAAIGAGIAGGAVAAGMGGGGGSGGSSGSSNGNNICQNQGFTSHEPCVEEDGWTQDRFCEDSSGQWYTCKPAYCFGYQTSCGNGYEEVPGDTCKSGDEIKVKCQNSCDGYSFTDVSQCPNGYTLGSSCLHGNVMQYKCDIPVTCPYQNTSCSTGFHENGHTCLSGETTYVECEPDTCEGYNIDSPSNCPSGYVVSDSCLSGNVTKYKCETPATCPYSTTECTGGYVATENTCQSGNTIYKECEQIQCGTNATWTEFGCVCNEGYENFQEGQGCSLIVLNCGMNAQQNGTQCQCNEGYTNWTDGYGCYQMLECGVHSIQHENVCVCENGYHEWTYGYGCYQLLDCGLNATQNGSQCQCDIGYTSWISGYGCYQQINCGANATQHGTECVCNDGYENFQEGQGCSLIILNCGMNAQQNGTQCQCNEGYGKNGYGQCVLKETRVVGKEFGVNFSMNTNLNMNNMLYADVFGSANFTANNTAIYAAYTNVISAYNNVSNLVTFNITNVGDGEVYGLYGLAKVANASAGFHLDGNPSPLVTQATANGNININNNGNGNVYGLYGDLVYNASTHELYGPESTASATGNVFIANVGSGDVFGMFGRFVANVSSVNTTAPYSGVVLHGLIQISNTGNGNVYGIKGVDAYNTSTIQDRVNASAVIKIVNYGTGNAYGIYGEHGAYNYANNDSLIISNLGNGTAFGVYSNEFARNGTRIHYSNGYYDVNGAVINIQNLLNGSAIGLYGKSTNSSYNSIFNIGTININNIGNGIAIGIFGDNNSTIDNSGVINITRTDYMDEDEILHMPFGTSGDVFGIYAKSGSTVNNSGSINIATNGTAYGIYTESGSTVYNTGTISINGISCTGSGCDGSSTYNNHIVLNGSTLYNSGLMMAPQMNLNSMGGNVVAGLGSQFVVDNELSGDLNISSELVQSGNQTTYIAENMIDAGDISGLNVRSASAMFDASVAENGHDVVMQMKDFGDLTDNKSLAAFLANNYANGKGQDLFSTLKSMDNMSAFNGTLSGLTGLNTFTQFAHEDLSAMREISFSMNNKLFENSDRDSFDISDSTGYFSFSNSHNSGSGQYGISSEKIAENWKLGYGMAMANINTGDGDNMHRQNKMWLFYMPATYTNDGYELVVAPKAGFANSEYSRRGYNNINYEGYIEKRIFGLMNDLRYPLSFGNWTLAPDLAFNAIVYTQSGHEDDQEFSLVIPDDRTVSVETGFGLYTKYEKTFESGARLKLNSGLMAYREFGDMYNIKLGIRGMDGTFNLYNNDYTYRGAASLGLDYMAGRFHLYGNAQYFMDNDNYMNFKGGVSYRF